MTDPRATTSPDDRRPIRTRAGESPDLADESAPITLARPRRESAPITRHLHDATNNPCALAFQSTALLDGADGTALTISELMRRWGVGRPKARDARQTLIRLGYWADVRPRTPAGEMKHVVRVWENPATLDDLQELALEYHSGTRIECGGEAYVIAADGKLIPAGRTECQKTATQIERERETSQRSLSIDRTRVTPDPCGGSDDALPEDATTAALRELVDGLPWGQYANRTGAPFRLTRRGVAEIVAAMRAALDAGTVTLDQVEQIARAALECAKSNPVAYLAGAFSRSALPEWVERVDVVRVVHPDSAPADTSAPSPTPDDVLDLPSDPQPAAQQGESGPEQRTERESPARRPQPENPPAPRVRAPEWVRRQNRELRRQARARRVPPKPADEID